MYNKVLWTLDHEMDATQFERLCTDLLHREGYRDIVPVGGTHDRGRDAEIKQWEGTKLSGGVTFFGYSLEENWEGKLKRELSKVRDNGHKIDFYVFVTSRTVTGNKRDKLEELAASEYKWQLIIFEREWLRHCLEERYPDLATKYLGIEGTTLSASFTSANKPTLPPNMVGELAWQLYTQGNYEAAILPIKELLKKHDRNIVLWQALSWSQYSLFHYHEALISIERALSVDRDNERSLSLKASILTEDGIRRGSKANVILGRDIFKSIVGSSNHWVNHYNYGNSLHALGDFEGARTQFTLAIELDPDQAIVWKNLGTVYYHLGNHDEELNCYDKALAIDNNLSEALASKGVTLLLIFRKPKEAIDLIKRAIELDNTIPMHWPKAWYWLSRAYFELGNYKEALNQIETGLGYIPSHSGFLDLKANILAKLWRQDTSYLQAALAFFQFRLELSKDDYDSFAEIIHLYETVGQQQRVWEMIAERLNISLSDFLAYIPLMEHSLEDYCLGLRYLDAYKHYREFCPISEYVSLLKENQIIQDSDFENALFLVCAIPFGLACEMLARLPENGRKRAIPKLHAIVFNSFEISLPQLALKLLKTIRQDTIEQTTDGLSRIVAFMPLIALLEFSRQIGWIGGFFKVPAVDLDMAMQRKNKRLARWQGKIASNTFAEISRVLKIFKD